MHNTKVFNWPQDTGFDILAPSGSEWFICRRTGTTKQWGTMNGNCCRMLADHVFVPWNMQAPCRC